MSKSEFTKFTPTPVQNEFVTKAKQNDVFLRDKKKRNPDGSCDQVNCPQTGKCSPSTVAFYLVPNTDIEVTLKKGNDPGPIPPAGYGYYDSSCTYDFNKFNNDPFNNEALFECEKTRDQVEATICCEYDSVAKTCTDPVGFKKNIVFPNGMDPSSIPKGSGVMFDGATIPLSLFNVPTVQLTGKYFTPK